MNKNLPYFIPCLFVIAISSAVSQAAPILNESGPALNMTAFPDDHDPNLYYLAPTVMTIAHDNQGVPEFSYMEQWGFWANKAVVQAVLKPAYDGDDVNSAEQHILKVNPRATFAALPFKSSSVVFDKALSPFVEENDCDHPAGVVGQEESCTFRLSADGASTMRSSFKTGLTITIQFQYTVEGVIRKPDRTLAAQENIYSVAGLLGGAELAKYPQLFRDSDGEVIGVE